MACVGRTLVRVGVVGALLAGTAVVIAGPQRIRALLHETRADINSQIDKRITDPVALRSQIRSLEAEYPKRIGAIRGDLAEVREQLSTIERDMAISQRVVAMADEDMAKLDNALAQAEEAVGKVVVADRGPREIVIVFRSERLGVDEAYAKRSQVVATRNAYQSRVADFERDRGYLMKQEQQLVSLLNKLETEQTSFQTQLFDLDRQIDAIARNERMIDLMEKRQARLDEQSRYSATSLDQVNGRLADLRARQEAQLEQLAGGLNRDNYEARARASIDQESIARGLYETQTSPVEMRPRGGDELEINADEKDGNQKGAPLVSRDRN